MRNVILQDCPCSDSKIKGSADNDGTFGIASPLQFLKGKSKFIYEEFSRGKKNLNSTNRC